MPLPTATWQTLLQSADRARQGAAHEQAVERQPYDVALMDVQMPEMDGLEATPGSHA